MPSTISDGFAVDVSYGLGSEMEIALTLICFFTYRSVWLSKSVNQLLIKYLLFDQLKPVYMHMFNPPILQTKSDSFWLWLSQLQENQPKK